LRVKISVEVARTGGTGSRSKERISVRRLLFWGRICRFGCGAANPARDSCPQPGSVPPVGPKPETNQSNGLVLSTRQRGDHSFPFRMVMLIGRTGSQVPDNPGTRIACAAYHLIGECVTNDRVPEGPPLGLTPILAVSDAHAAIAFYTQVFGATELARILAPDTKRLMHVRMIVFGTVFVFMDEIPELAANESRFHNPDRLNGTSVSLHLQVADAELVWKRACGSCSTNPARRAILGRTLREIERPVRARVDGRPATSDSWERRSGECCWRLF
jgi:uncharacterized glyoxalase superfamily protein PhnB